MINIITFPDGQKWACDVAFGGDGMTVPMLLAEGNIITNLGTQEIRYAYEPITQLPARKPTIQPSLFWTYQYRNSPSQPWNSFYVFREHEFLLEDFRIMSYYASTSAESFSTYTVVAVKFLRGEGADRVTGKVMLINGTVKRNLGGKTEVVEECETEEQRVTALKKWFGIELSEAQREGIKGYVSELRGKEITA
jgi:arylamine N-acetyltransferase